MSITIITKDTLRSSVEAATGGLVTVLYDDLGYPNYMRRFPKVKIEDLFPDLGLTGTHPAFIVNGVEKDEIFISVYLNSIAGDVGVSLPGLDPANYVDFDECLTYCAKKGPGWHLITNAEYSLIQGLALRNDFQPHGNRYWGYDSNYKYETGTLTPGSSPLGVANNSLHGRTLTGSGPVSWRHDNTVAGVADIVGNAWDILGGLRLLNGEIQIIPDNNAAAYGCDQSSRSSEWKAILSNGNLAAPGSSGTLKFDAASANGSGAVVLNTSITNQHPGGAGTYSQCNFKDITAKSGVAVPGIVKMLGLYPVNNTVPEGYTWVRNSEERIGYKGGSYYDGGRTGLFALNLNENRTNRNRNNGFRSALALIRQKPYGYGCRDGTRAKGG